ncbi:MAG: hypothetical protein IIT98_05730, partial [Kiritimatiellae bacterium]|nr:hypothetical protein [Kiritimatiellia bacterium]
MKTIARTVALAIAGLVALPAAAETPDYFVEWVQPESKLYVDTGITGKAGMKATVEFQNVSSGNFPCMLGSAKILDNGSWHHFGLCAFWGESMRFWYGTTYNSNGYGYVPYTYDFKTECTVAPDGLLSATCTKIDGSTETGSADWRESFGAIDTQTTMYLFAEHAKNPDSGAEIVENYHYGRLYHCAIYEYDSSSEDYVLASEFKPCVKDGVAGVYKTSTGEILYPAGGTLKAGPAKNDSAWAAGAKVGALEHPRTQWGRISYGGSRGGMGNGAWRNIDVSEYVPMGAGDIDSLLDSSWRDANLRWSQVRFDGWFQVSAEKAGTWSINQKFDDYFALFIDGSIVICNNSYTGEANSTVEVAEGWHRFTIVAGDTFGGYGPNKDFGEGLGVIPFVVTVNDATYAFNETNFSQGSGENKVTLEADTDWTEYPAVLLSHGAVLDLNGHILTVKDIASDGFVGAMVTNSAARKSVIVLPSAPSETAVVKSGLVQGAGANIFLVEEGTVSATTAYWTGDAGDGDALNSANWVNALKMDNIVPDAT